MIEYIMVSAIVMGLMIVVLLQINASIMEGPANRLGYVAFTDIGNGISTRIVDVYALAPREGNLTTSFDIPNEIAGKDYFVEIEPGKNADDNQNENVVVSRDLLSAKISLAGIGATKAISGNTTGRGLNKISYESGGY
jgi:hypothetical protein